MPKYPDIKVEIELYGPDGNAFAILGKVRSALRSGGATPNELEEFTKKSMSSDYDNVLETCKEWVNFNPTN